MTEKEADYICTFIEDHYDMVSQDDWYELCEALLGMVCKHGNSKGFIGRLADKHPGFFEVVAK